MRLLLILTFSALFPHLSAQNVNVTFRADLSNETVSDSGIHVAGSFQQEAGYPSDWDPSATELTDANQDSIYELTVSVPPGGYLYKFINGNGWSAPNVAEDPDPACALNDGAGNYNRSITVHSDTVLPVIRFDECNAETTFRVSLKGHSFDADSIFVVGDFQNAYNGQADWHATATKMYDADGDSVFERTVSIPQGQYQYLFANGDYAADSSHLEQITGPCTTADGTSFPKRTLDAHTVGVNLPGYCFGSCDVCQPLAPPDTSELPWWNDAVFYEIFVRSFKDSDGDGIGDFQGIIEKLNYLNDGDSTTTDDLGVTGIWLMPMHPSPTYHGYDVTDYRGVHPDYGTMADFKEFLEEAHQRGIKVIIDYVMNHSSNQHPWFQESRTDTANAYRDWYVWSDTLPGFQGPFGNGWHEYNNDWYYGAFWSGMPDLNYHHQPVREEMNDIATFWLDSIGIDGFRLDAIRYLAEDGSVVQEAPSTFSYLKAFNHHYKSVDPEAFTVGEVWTNTSNILPYVEGGDKIDFCFEFDLMEAILGSINNEDPANLANKMQQVLEVYPRMQYAPFISNHDINRVFETLDEDEAKQKIAASVYLTMPGVPFLYYGEEIGMLGSGPDPEKRKPMQWNSQANAGFSSGTPWKAPNSNYGDYNVATLRNEPNSMWDHYRKLVQSRNRFEVLRQGATTIAQTNDNSTFAFLRHAPGEAVFTIANLGNNAGGVTLSIDSSTLEPGTYTATDLITGDVLEPVEVTTGGAINWSMDTSQPAPHSTRIVRLADTVTEVVVSLPEVTCVCGPSERMQLFPNPANDRVEIATYDLTPRLIQLYALDGKLVKQIPANGPETSVDIADMAPGIYLVKLIAEERTFTKKLMVK